MLPLCACFSTVLKLDGLRWLFIHSLIHLKCLEKAQKGPALCKALNFWTWPSASWSVTAKWDSQNTRNTSNCPGPAQLWSPLCAVLSLFFLGTNPCRCVYCPVLHLILGEELKNSDKIMLKEWKARNFGEETNRTSQEIELLTIEKPSLWPWLSFLQSSRKADNKYTISLICIQ